MTVTAPQVQLRYGDKVLDSGSGGVYPHRNPYIDEFLRYKTVSIIEPQ